MENKSLESKTIIEKYTIDGQFKFGLALLELERTNKDYKTRLEALEEAMQFFSEWYNTTQRSNILLPNNLDTSGNSKIIL